MIFDSLLVIPEMVYTVKGMNKNYPGPKRNIILDYVFKYGCLILMFLPLGIGKFGFKSVASMLIYLFGNGILVLVYVIIFIINIKKDSFKVDLILLEIQTLVFILSGLILSHYLLVICAFVYGTLHYKIMLENKDQYQDL